MGGESETWDNLPFEKSGYWPPRQLSISEIKDLILDFGKAAERSIKAGVDVIEIHAAHGYLISQFLSPVTNRRSDAYGGTWETRTRLLREVIHEVRSKIPSTTPLFVRVSSTEWLENTPIEKEFGGSWSVDDTIRLAKLLPGLGVDLLDVSSGGNHPGQKVNMFQSRDYQIKIAAKVREEMRRGGNGLLVGAVGLITEAEQARNILEVPPAQHQQDENHEEGLSDGGEPGIKEEAEIAKRMVQTGEEGKEPMAGQFMREPEWVLKVAWKLGVDIAWPSQFLRVRFPKL
jgi:2,4-dienoyl-CoA reductase-like NADH-dependent reductase (Old Yellow Enzyme family)